MNISSGISEIIYEGQLPGKIQVKKAYVWPGYNAGKVVKIPVVHEKNNSDHYYIKRASYEPEQGKLSADSLNQIEYNSKGNLLNPQRSYAPGSFFEALA